MKPLLQRLAAPVHALPVDFFRIATGLIVLGYLVRLVFEVKYYHAPWGVLDHDLSETIFWFTWQPLFRPGLPLWLIQFIFILACGQAVAIVLGVRPRLCALLCYLIVVCSIRHRFLVVSVDDVIVHLLLFWLVLLPTGSTLTFRSWKLDRESMVPGGAVRLFTANVALIYLVAGLTKWMSPMWLEGNALYAILQVRPGWFANQIEPSMLAWLRPANYAALIVEPLFALLVFLPPGKWLKKGLGFLLVLFHLGIMAGLDVVFANLGCMASVFLLFRRELMAGLKGASALPKTGAWLKVDSFAAVVLFFLVGAMICSVTQVNWRKPAHENEVLQTRNQDALSAIGGPEQVVFFGGLWAVGLIQQYRLLDWIDERNFHVRIVVEERAPDGTITQVPTTRYAPSGMRGSLTLSYVLGATWLPVPGDQLRQLRDSINYRMARLYAKETPDDLVQVRVTVYRQRINPAEPSSETVFVLNRFDCESGDVFLVEGGEGF